MAVSGGFGGACSKIPGLQPRKIWKIAIFRGQLHGSPVLAIAFCRQYFPQKLKIPERSRDSARHACIASKWSPLGFSQAIGSRNISRGQEHDHARQNHEHHHAVSQICCQQGTDSNTCREWCRDHAQWCRTTQSMLRCFRIINVYMIPQPVHCVRSIGLDKTAS